MIPQVLKVRHKSNQFSPGNYLNAGGGEPWAGQFKAMDCPCCFLNARESTIEENLGLDDPTGSKNQN